MKVFKINALVNAFLGNVMLANIEFLINFLYFILK